MDKEWNEIIKTLAKWIAIAIAIVTIAEYISQPTLNTLAGVLKYRYGK